MKKRISKLLPAAVGAIKTQFGNAVIAREYQGYISSFGASVMQMGLLPTLAVFAGDKPDGGAAQDQAALLNILHSVVSDETSNLSQGIKDKISTTNFKISRKVKDGEDIIDPDLFKAAVGLAKNEREFRELRACILDAAIATKLAIRTFELTPHE